MEASGPVTTKPSSQYVLGATLGSNNTCEITSCMAAALYILSLSQPPRKVTFLYDSKCAANMVRGEARPKRNKALVRTARAISPKP